MDQVVWEWHLWDHILPAGQTASQYPGKIDLDYFASSRSSDWWHFNSVDYSAELDQIIISSRAASEVWIIDHDLTTAEAAGEAGDLLYRYGNPEAYGASGVQILVAQHDAEWLDEDTILVFDNGDPRERSYSRVVEIDLPDYLNSPSNVVLAGEIVWEYGAASGEQYFFADHISGSQRLASGNTLICSGTDGRFFEVTPDNDIVWEYVNPYTTTRNNQETNEVFRCELYPASFIGQELGTPSAQSSSASTSPDTSLPPVANSASASSSSAQGSPSSSPPPGSQNIGGGPPGIESVSPTTLQANGVSQLVTITLDDRFDPPAQVPFSSIAIGDIQATSWNRSALTIQAWVTIPSSTAAGEYQLSVTFPGREGGPIAFGYSIAID